MKGKTGFFALATVLIFACSAATAWALDFSADMVSTAKGKVFQSRIFMGKDKIRVETAEGITITRMDKKAVWVLMPKDKMYMEQAFDPRQSAAQPASSAKMENEISRTLMGKEKIDGRMTEKFQVVYTQDGKKETMFQWIPADIKIPVKMAAADNSWVMEYKNLKTGKQADDLFEIPAGYQKFSMGRPNMKDMLKGFGKQ